MPVKKDLLTFSVSNFSKKAKITNDHLEVSKYT